MKTTILVRYKSGKFRKISAVIDSDGNVAKTKKQIYVLNNYCNLNFIGPKFYIFACNINF